MVETVYLAMGQLVNSIVRPSSLVFVPCISMSLALILMLSATTLSLLWLMNAGCLSAAILQGQSWDFDHAKNLEKLNDQARRELNTQSLHHRHLVLAKKLWKIIAQFDKAVEHKVISLSTINEARAEYHRFFIYLTFTVKIILQDALLTYRKHLTSKGFSCLGHVNNSLSASKDEEIHRSTMLMLVGLTPQSQRVRRFRVLGYNPLWVRTFVKLNAWAYKKAYRDPLWRIIKAAEPFARDLDADRIVRS